MIIKLVTMQVHRPSNKKLIRDLDIVFQTLLKPQKK